MNHEYMEGLRFGLEQFEQAVKDRVEELGAQQMAGATASVRANLRGALRAYAEVVGALKTEILEAQGGCPELRMMQFDVNVRAIEKAESIQNELESTTNSSQRVKLVAGLEAAERQADGLIIRYALEIIQPPTSDGPVAVFALSTALSCDEERRSSLA